MRQHRPGAARPTPRPCAPAAGPAGAAWTGPAARPPVARWWRRSRSGVATRSGCRAARVCAIMPPIDMPTTCTRPMPRCSSSADGVGGHVAEVVGVRTGPGQQLAEPAGRWRADPAGPADVPVVEPDHPEAAVGEPVDHPLRPRGQVDAEAGDQQQRDAVGRARRSGSRAAARPAGRRTPGVASCRAPPRGRGGAGEPQLGVGDAVGAQQLHVGVVVHRGQPRASGRPAGAAGRRRAGCSRPRSRGTAGSASSGSLGSGTADVVAVRVHVRQQPAEVLAEQADLQRPGASWCSRSRRRGSGTPESIMPL